MTISTRMTMTMTSMWVRNKMGQMTRMTSVKPTMVPQPAWIQHDPASVPGLLLLSCSRPGSLMARADYCFDC